MMAASSSSTSKEPWAACGLEFPDPNIFEKTFQEVLISHQKSEFRGVVFALLDHTSSLTSINIPNPTHLTAILKSPFLRSLESISTHPSPEDVFLVILQRDCMDFALFVDARRRIEIGESLPSLVSDYCERYAELISQPTASLRTKLDIPKFNLVVINNLELRTDQLRRIDDIVSLARKKWNFEKAEILESWQQNAKKRKKSLLAVQEILKPYSYQYTWSIPNLALVITNAAAHDEPVGFFLAVIVVQGMHKSNQRVEKQIRQSFDWKSDESLMYITHIFLDPDYSKKGLGTFILARSLEDLMSSHLPLRIAGKSLPSAKTYWSEIWGLHPTIGDCFSLRVEDTEYFRRFL